VAQAALRDVLEPIFERDFAEQSYGFRPGRGCKDALRRVAELLKQGYTTVLDVDLKSYFDTIPHQPLLDRVRQKVSDGRVLSLIEQFLKQGVMEGLSHWTPEEGSPQGAVVSPLLSNIYLDPLDHQMAQQGFQMIRYADDFVILCRNREDAEAALALVQTWTTAAGLTLHPTKTQIVDADTEGFDFLGYHFKHGDRYPRAKSLKKLQDTIRLTTRRAHGRSMLWIIAEVNSTLRGWFGYFKHATKRYVFADLDVWIRVRLRSILRKRSGRRGKARPGMDSRRWPNAYFAAHGLFNLETAHATACQSLKRKVNH
jgi:RNA-directed DNA polymerase